MRRVIRQVQHDAPQFFQTVDSQPLESRETPVATTVQSVHLTEQVSFGMHAIVDTGCQRTAIGRNTLHRIAAGLPKELPIKYAKHRFRFSGIGGETITTEVAMLPVIFGRKPGMLRAAVLEDTPDAPLLISLPILRALGTHIDLNQEVMSFQSIAEQGTLEYNERNQLCLRLFDFDSAASIRDPKRDHWKPRKLVGDECIVFFMHETIAEAVVHNTDSAVVSEVSQVAKSHQFCKDNPGRSSESVCNLGESDYGVITHHKLSSAAHMSRSSTEAIELDQARSPRDRLFHP